MYGTSVSLIVSIVFSYLLNVTDSCHVFMKRMIVQITFSCVNCQPQGEEKSQFKQLQYPIKQIFDYYYL